MHPELEIGVVIGAHGLGGRLRVKLFTRDERCLRLAGRVRLQLAGGESSEHTVEHVELGRRGNVRLELRGCDHRDAAEALRGAGLWVRRQDLPPLQEGEFYLADTLGCQARTPEGSSLGTVVEVGDNGAQALFHLRYGQTLYNVPAVPGFIRGFDGETLVLELPDGLLEAVASTAPDASGERPAPRRRGHRPKRRRSSRGNPRGRQRTPRPEGSSPPAGPGRSR